MCGFLCIFKNTFQFSLFSVYSIESRELPRDENDLKGSSGASTMGIASFSIFFFYIF